MVKLKIGTYEKEPGVYVVSLFGPLDNDTYMNFELETSAIISKNTKVIILNLEGVNYISSMGIGAVFNLTNKMTRQKGSVLLTELQPQIKKVFDTVKAMPDSIFSSIAEVDEYLSAIQKRALDKDDAG